jgi:hypothetical protein
MKHIFTDLLYLLIIWFVLIYFADFVLLYNSAKADKAQFTGGPLFLSQDICDIELDVFCQTDPSVNSSETFASMVIIARDLYRNPSHYEVNLNMHSEWTKLTVPVKDLFL